jgi:hypothetical protein
MEYQTIDRQVAEMTIDTSSKAINLRGPIDGLPPANTKRWVIRRKAAVVAGVRNGIISLEDACRRYNLSVEEFLSWQRLIEDHGLRGLRVTRLKEYRERNER